MDGVLWAVGVQVGRAPLSRDLTGVMLAGRSMTELIGSVLAGYRWAGSPDFPAVLPERFSAIPGRARQKALDVLARLPLSLSELRDHPGSRRARRPPCGSTRRTGCIWITWTPW